jgi:hypothetical protein
VEDVLGEALVVAEEVEDALAVWEALAVAL